MTNPQAGWYSDPSNPSQLRWWDGTQWTNNTQAVQGAAQASAPQRPVTTTSSSYSAVPQSPLAANSGSAQAYYQAQQGGYPPAQGGTPGTYPSQQPAQGAPLAAGGFPRVQQVTRALRRRDQPSPPLQWLPQSRRSLRLRRNPAISKRLWPLFSLS